MPKLEYSVVGGIFEQPSGKCVEVGTGDWWDWLESDEAKSFRFETDHGVKSYTARKEAIQSKGYFWYAYKKVDKRLHKSYIGKTAELTLGRLETVADSLGQPKAIKLHTELGNQEEGELSSELHTELGNPESDDKLRARLAELEKENQQLKGRISYLLDERGLTQAKTNDDARFEIDRLQKLNDELEKENLQLNRVYSQSEDISRKYHQRATEAESRVARLEQSNSELQATNQTLEKQLSECSLKNQSLQKAYDHEAEDAKRYYVLWRKYPDLERKNKRLQEQVDAFEAAPLKILDGWIEANAIDLKPRTADKLRAYREYLLKSARKEDS